MTARQHGNDATIGVDSDEWAGNAARNGLLTALLDSEGRLHPRRCSKLRNKKENDERAGSATSTQLESS
jgi:hypothetical protein